MGSSSVIAVAWGGPAEYIDASCGILIPATDEASIVKGFADAQRLLAADGAMQVRLGDAGRQRVEMHYDWDRKVERMIDIYRHSIAEYVP